MESHPRDVVRLLCYLNETSINRREGKEKDRMVSTHRPRMRKAKRINKFKLMTVNERAMASFLN